MMLARTERHRRAASSDAARPFALSLSKGGGPSTKAANLPWWGRSSGVTLLELLIVLTLMAFIVAIVLPTLGGGVSTTELKSAAREVAAGLRYARGQAIVQRGETLLVLDVDARTFTLPPDTRLHRLPEKLEIKLFTAQRDLVGEKVGAIHFFPDGGSNGGRITLAAGERKYDVDVDWLTGRVTILD